MNHPLSREDFKKLIRGEVVELCTGDKIALQDIGYDVMYEEICDVLKKAGVMRYE